MDDIGGWDPSRLRVFLCPGSRLTQETQDRCLVSWDLSEWRIFPNPRLKLLKSMKDHIEQTKDPSHKSHHKQRSRNALLLAYAAALLQHSFTFSEGAIVKSNVTSRERRRWKWSQFLLARKDWVAPADCFACRSIIESVQLDICSCWLHPLPATEIWLVYYIHLHTAISAVSSTGLQFSPI